MNILREKLETRRTRLLATTPGRPKRLSYLFGGCGLAVRLLFLYFEGGVWFHEARRAMYASQIQVFAEKP
jgi:hypothetical protein